MLPRFILLYDLISCLSLAVYALSQPVNATESPVQSPKQHIQDTRSPAHIQSDITDFLDEKIFTGGYDRKCSIQLWTIFLKLKFEIHFLWLTTFLVK